MRIDPKAPKPAVPTPVTEQPSPTAAARSFAGFGLPSPGDVFGEIKDRAGDVFGEVKDRVGDAVDGIKAQARRLIDGFSKQIEAYVEDVRQGLVSSAPLSEAQLGELRKVYGDDVDFSGVRVVQMPPAMEAIVGKVDGLTGGRGQARTFTAGDVIFMPKAKYEQFLAGENNQLLVHEAGHVLQYRDQGLGVVADSVKHQLEDGSAAYDWKPDAAAGKGWDDLNVESQAALVDASYAAGYFDAPGSKVVVAEDGTGFRVIGPGAEVPEGYADVTSVLEDGLAHLRGDSGSSGGGTAFLTS